MAKCRSRSSIVAILLVLSACGPSATIKSIEWDDGDSGKINGERFRLYSVDAPETGGVGSRGGAKCEAERDLGKIARTFIEQLTEGARLEITASYGYDKMEEPRLLVDLSANGKDVGQAGIDAGHLAPWPHDRTKALALKPDWCG